MSMNNDFNSMFKLFKAVAIGMMIFWGVSVIAIIYVIYKILVHFQIL